MQRQNYRNIGNNFVQGGIVQPQGLTTNNVRQTKSAITPIPPATPTRAVVKSESVSPVVVPPSPQQQQQQQPTPMQADEPSNGNKSISDEDMMKLRKINFKKKVSGKEKRTRQNRKLFRMLTPRNAIAALNELHGQSINESTVVPTQGNKFEAEIVINNIRYQGIGNSKMQAKNSASEKALRDLVINKFQQIKNQESLSSTGDEDVNMEDDKTDDVPMLQLASFAIHKLFAEWEAEGFEIPLPKVNPEIMTAAAQITEPKQSVPKTPKVRIELPPNNLTMHPVMLLSIMRPCTTYSDLGSQGVTPNIIHTVGASVDGQNFIASGRSKKEARKRVATEILSKLFNWQGSCC